MPVNMDPRKRLKKPQKVDDPRGKEEGACEDPNRTTTDKFGQETEVDREKALADAESKNLWDATEVIDMDKW